MTRDALKSAVQPHLEQDFDALYDEYVQEQGKEDPVGFLAHLASFDLIPGGVARQLIEQAEQARSAPPHSVPPPPAWTGTGTATATPSLPGRFDDFEDEAHTVVADEPHKKEFKIPEKEPTPDPAPLVDEDDKATPIPQKPRSTPAQATFEELDENGDVMDQAPPAPSPPRPSPPSTNRGPATAPTPMGLDSSDPLKPPESDQELNEDEWDDEDGGKTRRTLFRKLSDGGLKVQTDVVEQERKENKRRRRRRKPKGDSTPPVGEEGRYTFVGVVGEGAMGKVHLAADNRLQRKVAFKAMGEEIAEHPKLAKKFAAEARITAQLDHPNIVPVYNLETAASYTMKLIKGVTMEDIIHETHERLLNRQALDDVHTLEGRLELFLRACDALHYAHVRGVVHRDLKPENIMVGEFNELYIMDWGIARLMRGEFDDKVVTGLDEDDEGDLVIGTPGYMSPEQAEGMNNELDGRSDQYSLGLILFELISLTPAVTGKAPLKIVMRHQDGEKDPLVHAVGQRIPRELKAIVHKATAKKREHRYGNTKELADDVRRYLRGEPILAQPDNIFQAAIRWMGKHRQLTAFVVLSVMGFFGFVAVAAIAGTQIALIQAEAREQQRSSLLSTAAAQSSLIDGQFLKYEGLLSVIATHAEDSLGRPALGKPSLYTSTQFDSGEAPPDLVQSKRYGRPVSLGHSAFVLPPKLPRSSVEGTMAQLQNLDRHYYKIMLRSHSESAATFTSKRAERALSEVGVPITRAYVGLESGLHQSYPGHGGWPEDYDPRTYAWYELAKSRRGPNWGAPSVDLHGQGLILTCAQALYDFEDKLLGVAGVDVTFDYIIEELLELPGFEDVPDAEAFLLDPAGKIVVRSSKKGAEFDSSADGRTLTLRSFSNPDVIQAVKERRSGYVQSGSEMIVYNRMNSIGWYYVVSGPERELVKLGEQ